MNLRPSGYARALVHAAVTLCLAAGVWFAPRPLALWALAALGGFFFIFELTRLNLRHVNDLFFCCLRLVLRPEEWWHPTGAAYVLWGAMVTAFCFSPEVAVAALAFLAVGDAVSSTIGNYFGSRRRGRFRLHRSLGCFLSCAAASLLLYYSGLGLSLPVMLAGALAVTLVETLPLPVNDNLSLPLAGGLVMALLCLC